jgi:hypothetical protein
MVTSDAYKERTVRPNKSIWYFPLLLGLLALATPAGLRADTLYNNLSSPLYTSVSLNSPGQLGDSFAVGATNFSFGSLTVLLDGAGSSETVTASLFSNVSGTPDHPGTVLETIGSISQVFASGSADYTFTLATPYTLLAGNTYWIVLAGSNGNTVGWDYAVDSSAQGVAGQLRDLGLDELDLGVHEPDIQSTVKGALQMEISSAVATPEPNMLLLLGMVIGALALFSRK